MVVTPYDLSDTISAGSVAGEGSWGGVREYEPATINND